MARLINHDKAKEFWDTISDPIVQALIQYAHCLIFTKVPYDFEGEFDLLYFYKILEAFLRDRERLAKALTGEGQEYSWAAD